MKREQLLLDFRSITAISESWKQIFTKIPDFIKENGMVSDWGGFVIANAVMRGFKVSFDTLKYDRYNIPFDFPDFVDRIQDKRVLLFSINMNGKPPEDSDSDFLLVYFSIADDTDDLYSMVVYSEKQQVMYFPEDIRELQEMLDYLLVIAPWQETVDKEKLSVSK